jgi:two-component system chemotaxis family response regulator WspR
LIKGSLGSEGLFDRILEAPDGEAGLRLADKAEPDLVLCDLVMPGLDGLGFLDRFRARERNRNIPVLMLSGEDAAETKVESFTRGANDYIVKPCSPAELVARVRNYLRLKQLQDDLEQKNRELELKNAELAEMSITDALTGLHNRRFFLERASEEFARARRTKRSLGVLLVDADHFKAINDTYGHQQGDRVLVAIARAIANATRQGDVVARFGGEEFVVLLPEVDDAAAVKVGEKLLSAVSTSEVACLDGRPITVSVGASTYPQAGIDSVDGLVSCADQALYRAKRGGRNRCELFQTQTSGAPGL